MFNSVNNPFGQRIESAISTGQEKRQKQQDQKKEEKKYLENDDKDEVKIGGLPILTEEDVLFLTKEYVTKLKSEHEDNSKIVKKFMKRNPNMTSADFHMIMFNETEGLLH